MSLTAANATIMISIASLFPTPQQLQGFAADDIFSTQPMKTAEVLMGVDGNLSGGFVYVPVEQEFTLQADSASCAIFDAWNAAQQQAADVFTANGLFLLTALGTKWTTVKGFLTSYMPMPDGKKLLQPRKFGITWQGISPAAS